MVFIAVLSGVSIVTARMLNAQAGERIGLRRSTFYNYAIGLVVSVAMMPIMGGRLAWPVQTTGAFMYLGGAMGVGIVAISSHVSLKISTMRMTLITFLSQIAAALAIDAWMTGGLSIYRAAGGALVLAGLWVQSRGEQKSG